MNLKSKYISVHRYAFCGLSYEEAHELGETMDYILDEDRAKKCLVAMLAEVPTYEGNVLCEYITDPIIDWACGGDLRINWVHRIDGWLPKEDFGIERQLVALCYYSHYMILNKFLPFGEKESKIMKRLAEEIKKTMKRLLQDD